MTVLILSLIISGCTALGEPDVRIDEIDAQMAGFSLSGDCPYLFSVKVHNEGNGLAENVKVGVKIYDANEKLLKTDTIYVGNVNPGEFKTASKKITVDVNQFDKYRMYIINQ